MKLGRKPEKWLQKKSKGFHGFPIATLAFYGPDDRRATKVVVGIFETDDSEVDEMRKWFTESGDLRKDTAILAEVVSFLRDREVRSVAMTEGIFGCPHEEGIDYPSGEDCPHCPFWAGRDRFAAVPGHLRGHVG